MIMMPSARKYFISATRVNLFSNPKKTLEFLLEIIIKKLVLYLNALVKGQDLLKLHFSGSMNVLQKRQNINFAKINTRKLVLNLNLIIFILIQYTKGITLKLRGKKKHTRA